MNKETYHFETDVDEALWIDIARERCRSGANLDGALAFADDFMFAVQQRRQSDASSLDTEVSELTELPVDDARRFQELNNAVEQAKTVLIKQLDHPTPRNKKNRR